MIKQRELSTEEIARELMSCMFNAAANTEKMSKTGLGPKKSWATNQSRDRRKRSPLHAVTA
jgi:hypothetical protein